MTGAANAHPQLVTLRSARRIHIIGGSGSGKTRLATRIGRLSSLPVEHLDVVAMDPVTGRLRPLEERLKSVDRISRTPTWVSEGIFVGWTDELLRVADAIVWLDHSPPRSSTMRVVRRFVRGAVSEVRRQQGSRRFGRIRDYRRQLGGLLTAIRAIWRYEGGGSDPPKAGEGLATRATTAAAVRPYLDKTVHCRTDADVERLLGILG